MLGIIIGVAVVIIVVAIGQGASERVLSAVNSLGSNLLMVRANWRRVQLSSVTRAASATNTTSTTSGAAAGQSSSGSANNLTRDDAKVIAKTFPQTVAMVAAQVRSNVQVRYKGIQTTTSVTGTTPEYQYVNNAPVSVGRWFTPQEDAGNQKVCIVGATVDENLTGDSTTNLVGQSISINKNEYMVIGMLASKGSGAFGQDQDDVIIVPLTTAMHRIENTTKIDMMSVMCTSLQMMPLAQQQISALLRIRHHLRPPFPDNDDFQVNSQTDIIQRQLSITDTMTALLTAVAVISLVVGGIGIMNIMLVSVTERTREIGIRKAIGATPRDILLQFLIESAIIALIGGLFGVVCGVGGSAILAKFGGWNVIVSSAALVMALIVSAAVGIFFGIYPASKASALNPIDALRYE